MMQSRNTTWLAVRMTAIPFNFCLYVRTVYLLFLRGKWTQLLALEADRKTLEPKLQAYAELFQATPLTEDLQIVPLLALAPEVADVAVNIVRRCVVEKEEKNA